jgi:hypothetical protein
MIGIAGWSLFAFGEKSPPIFATVAGAGLLSLAWIVFNIRRMLRRRTPAGNPLEIQLGQCGEVKEIAQQIELEFAGQQFRPRQIFASRTWLCYVWKKQIVIRRSENLIWAYLEQVKHKTNGIPTGTSNQVVVWHRKGWAHVLPVSKREAYNGLDALGKVAPWMLIGYSAARKESWNNDREDLIAMVDKARREGTGLPRIL